MVPLLVLLAVHRPFDGEDAIHAARAFLRRMKVRDLGGVRSVSQLKESRWGLSEGSYWSVGFDLPKGAYFSVVVRSDGTAFYAHRSDGPGFTDEPADVAQGYRFAADLMRRVPHAVHVRPSLAIRGFYFFDAVVNGLTFFNPDSRFGYLFQWRANGSLTLFNRSDRVPPVVSPKPSVDHDDALTRLVALWSKAPHRDSSPQRIEAELGYYLVRGESTARLVWRGDIVSDDPSSFDSTSFVQGFVDAATGGMIRPNPEDSGIE